MVIFSFICFVFVLFWCNRVKFRFRCVLGFLEFSLRDCLNCVCVILKLRLNKFRNVSWFNVCGLFGFNWCVCFVDIFVFVRFFIVNCNLFNWDYVKLLFGVRLVVCWVELSVVGKFNVDCNV